MNSKWFAGLEGEEIERIKREFAANAVFRERLACILGDEVQKCYRDMQKQTVVTEVANLSEFYAAQLAKATAYQHVISLLTGKSYA